MNCWISRCFQISTNDNIYREMMILIYLLTARAHFLFPECVPGVTFPLRSSENEEKSEKTKNSSWKVLHKGTKQYFALYDVN
jgi:hypothetical protein